MPGVDGQSGPANLLESLHQLQPIEKSGEVAVFFREHVVVFSEKEKFQLRRRKKRVAATRRPTRIY